MNLISLIYLIYILCLLFTYSTLKKWWELAGGRETVGLNQMGIYYFCMKTVFQYLTASVECPVRTSHYENLVIMTRF